MTDIALANDNEDGPPLSSPLISTYIYIYMYKYVYMVAGLRYNIYICIIM